MHALKELHDRLYELTNHPNGIVDVGLGDGRVYEASEKLSEPFLVESLSEVGHDFNF